MNNWIPMQPVVPQNNGSQTTDIAIPSTQMFDNSYNPDPRWIQPIQTQQITHPYEPSSKPTYGNENNISKLDPKDITSSDPSYGLETSVVNFNQTLTSKPQDHVQNWSFEESDLLNTTSRILTLQPGSRKIAKHKPASTRQHSTQYDS